MLKKDFLTESEVVSIVKVSIEALLDNPYAYGTRYNYVDAEITFFRTLAVMCLEGYSDAENDEKAEEIYNDFYESCNITDVLDMIKNAKYAYSLLNKIVNKIDSVENVIDHNLQGLLKIVEEKIPDKKSLEKLVKKLPKEWQKVVEEHQGIMNLSKEEFDDKYNVDETK